MLNKLSKIKNSRPISLTDVIFCCALIICFTAGIIFFMPRQSGAFAEVYRGNTLEAVLPLNKDTVYIYNYKGHYNKVVIKNGKISIEETNCKDNLCKNYAPANIAGSTIICLPHELFIVIKGNNGVDQVLKSLEKDRVKSLDKKVVKFLDKIAAIRKTK